MVMLKPLPYLVRMTQAKDRPVFRKEMREQVQEMIRLICELYN